MHACSVSHVHLTTLATSDVTQAYEYICKHTPTHGSFLIRHQRGHPGVVLPLLILIRQIIRKECNQNWAQLETSPIRNEPNWKLAMCTCTSLSLRNRLCVSSLLRGHANLLCIVPILTDDPRRESEMKTHFLRRVVVWGAWQVNVCKAQSRGGNASFPGAQSRRSSEVLYSSNINLPPLIINPP